MPKSKSIRGRYRGKPRRSGVSKIPLPTTFLSGTPEKLAVLIERERLGLELSSPLDARPTDGRHVEWGFEGNSLRPKVAGEESEKAGVIVTESRYADRHKEEENFGQRLQRVRIAAGMSRKVLSLRSGLDWSFISRLERGKQSPSLDAAVAIADVLRVSLDSLAGRNPAAL